MKLMFLLEDYTPDVFASTVRMREMIAAFSRNSDVEIRVVVYNPRGKYSAFEAIDGNVTVKRYVRKWLPESFYIVKHINPLALLDWMRIIRKEKRAFKPDLIITTVPSMIPTIASYLAPGGPKPLRQVDFRDDYLGKDVVSYIIEHYPPLYRALCRRIYYVYHWLFLEACRHASLISTVYDDLIDDIDRLTGGKVPVAFIPNGINTREFNEIRQSLDREETLKAYGVPPENMSVIYVGVYGGWYSPELVIEPLKRLKDAGRELNFIIIGDGPTKDIILETASKNGMEKNLFMPGKLPHEEVVKLLLSSDIALYTLSMDFPRADRLLSVKVLEYMASWLPIISISPERSIVARTIREYGIGEVVNSNDPAAIGDAMARLMERRQAYKDRYRTMAAGFNKKYDREKNNVSLFGLIRQRLEGVAPLAVNR